MISLGRVHRDPRRDQVLDHGTAFPRRRGCDAEGGAAATAVEKQSVENWMFQHPKAKNEHHLPMYEPLPSPRQSHSQNDPKTLPGPRPLSLAASTVAPAEISCSTTAAWPLSAASCSAVLPRAPRMRRRRRGCCGCRRETRRSTGMFLRVVGQKNVDRSYIDRR